MKSLARFLVARPLLVVGLFVVLGGLAARELRHLGFSFSIQPLLEANDEARAEVDRYLAELPPEDYDQLLTISKDSPLEAADLDAIERLRQGLESDETVSSVLAITNVPVIEAQGMLPRIVPFRGSVGNRRLIDAAADHPLLIRRLISADGCSTALLVTAGVKFAQDDESLLSRLERRAPEFLAPGWRLRFIGDEVARRAMTRHMKSDLKTSLMFQALFFAILLPLIFRSFRGIFLPLLTVVIAEVLCLGLLAACGHTIGLIDLAVPGVIMMIAICDSVHMLQRFEEAMAAGLGRRDAVVDMLQHVGFACFQTSLTTAIGFLSLAAARHRVVQAFGIEAAIAVMITFLVVITLLPTLLALWPVKKAIMPRVPALVRLGYGRRGPAFLITGLIFGVALFGMSRMVIDSHWLEELPEDEAIVQDLRWFEDRFAGIMILDIRLEGDLAKPENIRAIAAFEDAMLAEDGVNQSESVVDWLAEVAGHPAILDEAAIARAYAFIKLSGDRFPTHILRRDLQAGRVVFRTRDDGTRRFFELRQKVATLSRDFPPELQAEVAGFLEMAHESSRLIATTMLESFGLSLVAICLLIGFIYRSWRIGLAAVIPNVMPIAIALGVNGLVDIPVRIGIVMIYSLGLGLAVDDTIHIISRFLEELPKRGNRRAALEAALRGSGSAIMATSLVLTIGALCYLPSGFRSLHDVGVLLSTIVVTALLFDLLLLPHLLELAVEDRAEGDEGDQVSANGKSGRPGR